MKPRFLLIGLTLALVFALVWRFWPDSSRPFPNRFARPYGMAPAAFDGLLRACDHARIQPHRIGQTIGDSPLSVGYHKRDGRVKFRGKWVDYTAAVDLDASDLTRAQLNRFLESLAAQGFAAWYREKGEWRGIEHIHAIYAPLEMKPQLRLQVRQWLRERQGKRAKTYRWERRWRRFWQPRKESNSGDSLSGTAFADRVSQQIFVLL